MNSRIIHNNLRLSKLVFTISLLFVFHSHVVAEEVRSNVNHYEWFSEAKNKQLDYSKYSYGLKLPDSVETLLQKKFAPYDTIVGIREFAYIRKRGSDLFVFVVSMARVEEDWADCSERLVVLTKDVREKTWHNAQCHILDLFPSVLFALFDDKFNETVGVNIFNDRNEKTGTPRFKVNHGLALPDSCSARVNKKLKKNEKIAAIHTFAMVQHQEGKALGLELGVSTEGFSQDKLRKFILIAKESDKDWTKAGIKEVSADISILEALKDTGYNFIKDTYPGLSGLIVSEGTPHDNDKVVDISDPNAVNDDVLEAVWSRSTYLLEKIKAENEERIILLNKINEVSETNMATNFFLKLELGGDGITGKQYMATQIHLLQDLSDTLKEIHNENLMLKGILQHAKKKANPSEVQKTE